MWMEKENKLPLDNEILSRSSMFAVVVISTHLKGHILEQHAQIVVSYLPNLTISLLIILFLNNVRGASI